MANAEFSSVFNKKIIQITLTDPGRTERAKCHQNVWFGSVVIDVAIGEGGQGLDSRAGQIGHSVTNGSHCWYASSELCCPGAKPRRMASPLVTCFGVLPRV